MKNNRRLFESVLKENAEKRLKEKMAEYKEEKEKTPFNPSNSTAAVISKQSSTNATTTLDNNTNITLSHRLPITTAAVHL